MKKILIKLPYNQEIKTAMKLCNIINDFPGDFNLSQGSQVCVDGKSLMGIFTLRLSEAIIIEAINDDIISPLIMELSKLNIFIQYID